MAKLFLNSFHSGHSKKTHTTASILLCASVRRTDDLKIKIGQRSALTAGSPHCHRFSDNDTRHKLATPKISTRPCSTLNRQRRRPRLRHSSSSSCSSSSWASSAQALRPGPPPPRHRHPAPSHSWGASWSPALLWPLTWAWARHSGS